ncbi:MAG TPA: hypothetical protein VFH83_05120 [Spirochaetia bacterium]|nr:hypothetical protein [Spirochaetia bacterium]
MTSELLILICQTAVVYLLVLGMHSLRRRTGLSLFYALLGGLTAIMSWVTDAGLSVHVGGVTFVVGSTVFYTALLLGVFVVYVFDGPLSARTAILGVAVVSTLTPLVSAFLHLQAWAAGSRLLPFIPTPSLRINAASVAATLVDMVFLAVAWEYLGRPRIHRWLRVYLTLLGVLCLDVVLFNTGAFAGTGSFLTIVQGTLISRVSMSVVALPFLLVYLEWQSRWKGEAIENRPVLAILRQVAKIEAELSRAQVEIELRKAAERQRDETIRELRQALSEVKTLRGLLPICSRCKRIRDDSGYWNRIETYIRDHTDARFTHGICPDCARELYPDVPIDPE